MDRMKEAVKTILEKLHDTGECHNMDIFINSSVLLSASGKKQYFEVNNAIQANCLVLYLISDGRPVVTILEDNIRSICVFTKECKK
jgi:membrane glycosyltransferase